jgi:hypothetical protein
MKTEIRKKLSANDVGDTGAHQAGILVPKSEQVLSFFPGLDGVERNPRATLVMRERSDGTRWEFNFIYYNNRLFGGTRNEFRLTCMTKYLRAAAAKAGDELIFAKDKNASYVVDIARSSPSSTSLSPDGVLILSGGWKVINV